MVAIRALIGAAVVLTQIGLRVAAAPPGVIDPGGPDLRPRLSDPDPGPSDPGPSDPGPSDPGPSPSSESGHGAGDAEAAPGEPPSPTTPPARAHDRRAPRRRVALLPRFAYRLGEAGRAVTPAPGYGLVGTIEITYLRARVGLEAALGVDFSYDRFATSEQGTVDLDDGTMRRFGYTRVISETSFILVHSVGAAVGPVRPYFTLGGGLGLGYFDSATLELRPGTARDAHFLGRASLGVDVALGNDFLATIRADYTAVRDIAPFVTTDGRPLALFGDLLGVGAGVAYRF